jgi:hypothetical protein
MYSNQLKRVTNENQRLASALQEIVTGRRSGPGGIGGSPIGGISSPMGISSLIGGNSPIGSMKDNNNYGSPQYSPYSSAASNRSDSSMNSSMNSSVHSSPNRMVSQNQSPLLSPPPPRRGFFTWSMGSEN